jgi:hypothetical protein
MAHGSLDLYMTINVINDIMEVKRHKLEAPSVGNPLSTPQMYLKSNCGAQVFQNSLLNPEAIRNCMVSATIQNTFSAGYPISASGDAPVQIPTSYLNNLDFQLVDANFQSIQLLNPMYLTICVIPVPQDANNDLSQWVGHLPLDAPTPEQKAQTEAEEKTKAEAQAQAEEEAKQKADTEQLAYQLVVQVLAPIAQQQMVQQEVAMAQMQLEQVKQGIVQNLLQDQDVLAFIQTLPKNKVPKFIDKLADDIINQAVEEEEEKNETAEVPPTSETDPSAMSPQEIPPQPPVEAPATPDPNTEVVQETTPENFSEKPTLEDAPITGQM